MGKVSLEFLAAAPQLGGGFHRGEMAEALLPTLLSAVFIASLAVFVFIGNFPPMSTREGCLLPL